MQYLAPDLVHDDRLGDPPETWTEAPDWPPESAGDDEVIASNEGGLLVQETDTITRFVFSTTPVAVRE